MSWVDKMKKFSGGVSLVLNVAGTLVPVFNGILASIRAIRRDDGVVEYHIVIESGQANIESTRDDAEETLRAINEERARDGLDPLEIPD